MKRILLLTFDRLPNRQLIGDDSSLTQAYEQLDSVSVYFENHYLQATGLPGLSNGPDWSELVADFGQTGPRSFSQLLQTEQKDLTGFTWASADLEGSDEESAAQFGRIVDRVRAGDWSLVFLTSLNGQPQPENTRFATSCFEGLIRVPLWVLANDYASNRIQALTGSYDLATTVRQLLTDAPVDSTSLSHTVVEPNEGEQKRRLSKPISLVKVMEDPGHSDERLLEIRLNGGRAIRSDSFLFVRPEPEQESDAVLYAKPDDCWNVHDVSSEYLQLVQDFEALLVTK